MRTVLIGSDFMYDKDGNLRPIEINTALSWDQVEKIEEDVDCIDLTGLIAFINSNNFTTMHYIGEIRFLSTKLQTYCSDNSITYEYHEVGQNSITVPYIEDNEETLIIRSSYDTTALVDDTYCRDKVNFMDLIKDSSFGSQFAYIDNTNTLVNHITTINNNGEHPNFILKAKYPQYDKEVYPKFFKVSNQLELDTIIANNVTSEYFLVEFLFNNNFKWNGHTFIIRSLNLLFPPNLESIQIGQYTKISKNILFDNVTYNPITFEVDNNFRKSYNTYSTREAFPKLLDTDMVEMSDGTLKTALDLQIGDIIKTIEIPNENGVSIDHYISSEFGLNYETLVSSAIYSTNTVINKQKVSNLTYINTLTFEDGSSWEDTTQSRYLIERAGIVKFETITTMVAGDVVILIDTTDNNLNFVRKTIISNTEYKTVFSGWFIIVETAHIFLTKTTGSTNNESYVSIEANGPGDSCSYPYQCTKSAPNCSLVQFVCT
jgi:hypothetical protein